MVKERYWGYEDDKLPTFVEYLMNLGYGPYITVPRRELVKTTERLVERVKSKEIIDFVIVPFLDTGPAGITHRGNYSIFTKKDKD